MFGSVSIIKNKKEKREKKEKVDKKEKKKHKKEKKKKKRRMSTSSSSSKSCGEDEFMSLLMRDEESQNRRCNKIEEALGDNRQSKLRQKAQGGQPGSLSSKFTSNDLTDDIVMTGSTAPVAPQSTPVKYLIDEKGYYNNTYVPDHLRDSTIGEFESLLAKGKQQQQNRDKSRLKKQKSSKDDLPEGDLMKQMMAERRDEILSNAAKQHNQDKSAHRKVGGAAEAICYGSENFSKDNLISMGDKTLLMLPVFTAVTDDQCYLTTIEPRTSSLEFDDHEAAEIRNFQKCLIQKASNSDCGMIFSECVMNLNENRQVFIECIPVPNDVFNSTELYFFKALDEIEDEFAQTHKRVINTQGKHLRSCIPPNMSYYSVSFNLDGGYAHIIHTQHSKFRYLTVDICGGLLGVGMNGRLSADERNRLLGHEARIQFRKSWNEYDWTKMLDEGSDELPPAPPGT